MKEIVWTLHCHLNLRPGQEDSRHGCQLLLGRKRGLAYGVLIRLHHRASSGYTKFSASSDGVVRHEDSQHQEIHLQMGKVEIEGDQRKALLVDSDANALKERSMHDHAYSCYEHGLDAINAVIMKKDGKKKRDIFNNKPLGRLDKQ